MSAESNKDLVRRYFEEVEIKHNIAAARELMVENYRHHDPVLPPELQTGRDNYLQVVGMFVAAFPGYRMTIEQILAEGDRVAYRWRFRGNHQGELMGVPPSGKDVEITGIQIVRIEAGKVAESWVSFDALRMMQQIGAAPTPEGATA